MHSNQGNRSRSVSLDRSVLTGPFLLVLVLTFLGFAFEQVLRPVIPLMIIDRGGDAVLIGAVAAVHALPSIVFRPYIGQLVDNWHHGRVLRIGAALAAVAPAGLLLPGILSLVPVRFLQGSAWAVYSVSTHTLMAKASPPQRRGEASGYFQAMPALATLISPGVGVALYIALGEVAPVLVAGALAAGALAITTLLRTEADGGVPIMPSPQRERSRMGRLVEPSALPATLMTAMFMSAHALFMVFPPVYAIAVGAPIEALAAYYPAYGIVMAVSQFAAGRVSDRIGRGSTIRIGCALGIAGLAIAGLGTGMVTLATGAAVYAIGASLVSPTLSALTIDRAPPSRLGSAMATYSIGYQLATGASSLGWGALIVTMGFGSAFIAAIALQLATIAASVRYVR